MLSLLTVVPPYVPSQQGLDLYNFMIVKMELLADFFNAIFLGTPLFETLSPYSKFALLISVNSFALFVVACLIALGLQVLRVTISIFR